MSGAVGRVLAIADRVAAGSVEETDRDELNTLLLSDPACLETWLRAMRQQRLLRGLLQERAAEAIPHRRPQPRRPTTPHNLRGRPLIRLILAAAAVLALVVGAWFSQRTSPASLLVIAGIGQAEGTRLKSGDWVPAGSRISALGQLDLRATDGSTLVLADGGRLVLLRDDAGAFAAELAAGAVEIEAQAQHGRPFAIATPHAVASVRGTGFSLAIEGTHTRLAVREGLVRFTRRADGVQTDVGAGGTASTAPAGNPPATWRINLGGPPVLVDGVSWLGHDEALARGMRTSADSRARPPSLPLDPEPDSTSRTLLATALWRKSQRWSLALPLPNGSYRLRLWLVENDRRYDLQRKMDVHAEGAALFTGVGNLAFGSWQILGPAVVRVSDGALDLEFIAAGDIEPHAMGLEVLPDNG